MSVSVVMSVTCLWSSSSDELMSTSDFTVEKVPSGSSPCVNCESGTIAAAVMYVL